MLGHPNLSLAKKISFDSNFSTNIWICDNGWKRMFIWNIEWKRLSRASEI